jgi:hypothetical protein
MIGVEPSSGSSNEEMITWDAYNAAAGISAMQISTEPTPASSNFEMILWDLYQAILTGGGGGGGGLPSGSNGAVLAYFGNWFASDALIDASGNSSYAIQDRIISDGSGLDSVLGERRKLVNTNSVDSINWEEHELFDFTGNLAIDYDERKLFNLLSNTVYDWQTNRLYDSSGIQAIDVNSRSIVTSLGTYSIFGEARTLVSYNSFQVFNWADVANEKKAFFYNGWNIGFGNVAGPSITHPITIGTPGIRFSSGLAVGAPVGSPIGGITISVDGTPRTLAFY